ncbi:hypothetical protein [Gordonia sp. VNK21]|uniref:hypothetical protein n=1 Tax=Gordonia sp. VNK21 TaxID=3382483 RepID=UPI0038D379A3
MITPLQVVAAETDDQLRQLTNDLGLAPTSDLSAVMYELLRAVLTASSIDGTSIDGTTLIDRTVELIRPAAKQKASQVRAEAVKALDALHRIGDAGNVDDDRWIGSPTYQVETERPKRTLLVSGLPLYRLPEEIRRSTVSDGPVRIVGPKPAKNARRVAADRWLSPPGQPLAEWTTTALNSGGLESVDKSTLTSAAWHCYLPEKAKASTLQQQRWRGLHKGVMGRVLTRAQHHDRIIYLIAACEKGVIRQARIIDSDSALRLMYGLDARARKPTVAHLTSSGPRLELTTTNPLPIHESRSLILAADSVTGSKWILPADYPPEIPPLRDLRVTIRQDPATQGA